MRGSWALTPMLIIIRATTIRIMAGTVVTSIMAGTVVTSIMAGINTITVHITPRITLITMVSHKL